VRHQENKPQAANIISRFVSECAPEILIQSTSVSVPGDATFSIGTVQKLKSLSETLPVRGFAFANFFDFLSFLVFFPAIGFLLTKPPSRGILGLVMPSHASCQNGLYVTFPAPAPPVELPMVMSGFVLASFFDFLSFLVFFLLVT
jgi:hypothetical protein